MLAIQIVLLDSKFDLDTLGRCVLYPHSEVELFQVFQYKRYFCVFEET